MAVTVGSEPLTSVSHLTEATTSVLSLIPDGVEWVDWAVSTRPDYFGFANEADLVRGVQAGLHGASLVSLPRIGLLIGPAKLLEFSLNDLSRLIEFELGDDADAVVAATATRVITSAGLVTAEQLQVVNDFLERNGQADLPMLQSLSLISRRDLLDQILDGSSEGRGDRRLQRAGIEFAAEHAASVDDLAAYYSMFMDLQHREGTTPAAARDRARSVRAKFAPTAFAALRCPVFEGPPTPRALRSELLRWSGNGHLLGFARLSTAIAQIVRHDDFEVETSDPDETCRRLLRTITDVATADEASSIDLDQDGMTIHYRTTSANGTVTMTLDPSGQLTARSVEPADATATPTRPEDSEEGDET